MAQEEFEIFDGVRRSKAAAIAGRSTIRAQITDDEGDLGPVIEIPLGSLRSPHKDKFDVSSSRKLRRWMDILRKTQQGSVPPPIVVRRGNRGPRIDDVDFEY